MSYLYDANGNMTSDGTQCREYNDANQLKKVKKCSDNKTIAEYVYDHTGKRIIKKEYKNGILERTVYSPSDEYETVVLASNGAKLNTTYYKVNDEVVAKKNPDGNINYYHNDHLGSNSVLTNQSGAVVEKTTYEPYGEVKSGGTKSKFGYTGQEKDQETGLNYYDSRYYDPHLQRFVQPDTMLPDVYDPQQLNRYSYANNNPLRYTDPTGHGVFDKLLKLAFKIPVIGSLISKIPGVQQYMQWVESPLGGQTTQEVVQAATKVQSNPIVQKAEDAIGKVTNNQIIQKTSSNLENIANTGSSIINISAKGLNHVLNRHIASGINSQGNSIFSNPEEIPTLIKNAEEIQPILQANGNLRRIVDANKAIGIDVVTGKATSMYTVITDKVGNLITSHPGVPR